MTESRTNPHPKRKPGGVLTKQISGTSKSVGSLASKSKAAEGLKNEADSKS